MLRYSLTCIEINAYANKKDSKECKWCNIWVSLTTKTDPKDKPLLDRRIVLEKDNSLGSDRYKLSRDDTNEHEVWNEDQKNVIKNRLSEKTSA